ncbi:hypothetical protein EVAR_102342_1 [Eumeta japonica]|uniref:Uncharacterized protein n=1 Tax=Eumeta variegata TaxID=151549 RepID=A0A4C1XJ79_EUMVA|nr:hypothetical protein EVAR_102342_1 [Eumeta japonica]
MHTQFNARNSAALVCVRMMQCAVSVLPDPSFFPSAFLFYAIAIFSDNFTTAEFHALYRTHPKQLCQRIVIEVAVSEKNMLEHLLKIHDLTILAKADGCAPCRIRPAKHKVRPAVARNTQALTIVELARKLDVHEPVSHTTNLLKWVAPIAFIKTVTTIGIRIESGSESRIKNETKIGIENKTGIEIHIDRHKRNSFSIHIGGTAGN